MPRKQAARDSTALFEAGPALAQADFVLRLFIAGNTPRSSVALANLKELCDSHLAGRYELEVIDVYQQPKRARDEQIVAVPTLLKVSPEPIRRLIGDLSQTASVLIGLGIEKRKPAKKSAR